MLPVYLTVKQVAERLQIKEGTLYAWAAQQRIPSIRINGLIRFPLDELERWLATLVPEKKVLPTRLNPKRSLDIQVVIARAKDEAYNSFHGETRPKLSPNGKEEE